MKRCPDCKRSISKKGNYCASCAKKGERNPNYKDGLKNKKRYCVDCNKRISTTNLERLPERCRPCDNKLRWKDSEYKKKTSLKISLKTKIRLSVPENNPMFGRLGKLHPNYIENVIRDYPFEFNDKLKNLIRKRDNYTCQKCGIKQEDYYRKLDIHHIDYYKDNLKQDNLITLCQSCNNRANFNRDYWYDFFKYIVNKKEIYYESAGV